MCNKPLSSLRINQRASRGDCGDAGDASYDYALEADLDSGELLDDELLDCLSDGKTKDTLLLDLEEWATKYGYKDSEQAEDDYYTERSNAGAEIFSSM